MKQEGTIETHMHLSVAECIADRGKLSLGRVQLVHRFLDATGLDICLILGARSSVDFLGSPLSVSLILHHYSVTRNCRVYTLLCFSGPEVMIFA